MQNLPEKFTKTQGLVKKGDHYELMPPGTITKKGISEQLSRVKVGFPSVTAGYLSELKDLFVKHGYSDEYVEKSVDHVLSTCKYPIPVYEHFFGLSHGIKFYTYHQMLSMLDNDKNVFNRYSAVFVPNTKTKLFASNADIELHSLTRANEVRN